MPRSHVCPPCCRKSSFIEEDPFPDWQPRTNGECRFFISIHPADLSIRPLLQERIRGAQCTKLEFCSLSEPNRV